MELSFIIHHITNFPVPCTAYCRHPSFYRPAANRCGPSKFHQAAPAETELARNFHRRRNKTVPANRKHGTLLLFSIALVDQAHLAPGTVEPEPVSEPAAHQKQLSFQRRMLLQALPDLTPNAIGRTHDRMPCRRRFQIESACNLPHPVIAVKLLGQTIRNILLGRKDFRRIGRRPILGQNRMDDRAVEPRPPQTLHFAAQPASNDTGTKRSHPSERTSRTSKIVSPLRESCAATVSNIFRESFAGSNTPSRVTSAATPRNR